MTKLRLIERYQAKHDLPLSHPRVAQMDLAYHDLRRSRGLYALLEKRGQVDRVATDLEIFEAKETPPQTTRARLRGEFIRHAQEKRRDFTVDWVHLKLNDQAQRTVLCKDPFRAYDERVERLIAEHVSGGRIAQRSVTDTPADPRRHARAGGRDELPGRPCERIRAGAAIRPGPVPAAAPRQGARGDRAQPPRRVHGCRPGCWRWRSC